MIYTREQLEALEKKLISDLEAVRRVMALGADPDLIRVSELLGAGKNGDDKTVPLFESTVGTPLQQNPIKNKEVAEVILKFAGPFKFADAVAVIRREFPDRPLRPFTVPAVLRKLRMAQKIKEIVPREGRNGATYEGTAPITYFKRTSEKEVKKQEKD
ncbi:MAG: hypothetical protein KGJ88_13805 [Verrucomicrobiota bacterium]|nr:hypothetical protein [Verrucomicrobiota bacterium]